MSELVTPNELDAYLSGDPQGALNAAEAVVRAFCEWHVAPVKSETVTVWARGDRVLLVPSLHIVSVESVTVDGEPVEDFTWREHGTLHPLPDGHWWHDHRWCRTDWTGRVEVSLTHGYDDVADVKDIIMRVAARSSLSAASPFPTNQVRVGQVSEGYEVPSSFGGGASLTDEDRQALAPYKLPPRP